MSKLTTKELAKRARVRFFSKVNKADACWLWEGCKWRSGYGRFTVGCKSIAAHRYSWLLYNGPILNELMVLHKCDNKACVNPEHLFLGTQIDNMRDCSSKKRFNDRSGVKNPAAKLTGPDVKNIIAKYKTGKYTFTQLGYEYGVAHSTVWRAVMKKTWRPISVT